ncbi:MAG: 16S rRNA (cytosine(967)-C(5))-methyltransferase RsmB [Oscillospiraceae bacterium]|nr:16S rRNA (cytosine(967)-C(5))-methyltransferase RsmB [Oscillospiraceae bacterium]
MQTPREICLGLLVKVEKNSSFSSVALDNTLSKYSGLSDVDRRFISALYYGVIERRITLDAVIAKYSNRPIDKLNLEVREILRMGIYQLLYMDSVPDNAAVDESVKLAKINNQSASGFVNAILRSFIRDGKKLPGSNLSLEYSCPQWLVDMWLRDYGEEIAISILKSSLGRPPTTVRFNTCKFEIADILSELALDGIEAVPNEVIKDCYNLKNCGSAEKLSAYKRGMFHVQDASCQLCATELGAKEGETVLDVCSAPGGKSFTVAEIMNDMGRILAFDLHANRAKLITDGAKRLGLCTISAGTNNAKVYKSELPMADRVLCDVPCSGLGVIGRKPEIKYNYSCEDDLKQFPIVQYEILKTSSQYVRPGGTLLYSTCTLNRAENDLIAEKFLKENPSFEGCKLSCFGDYKATITPASCQFGGDGFFMAKFSRIG